MRRECNFNVDDIMKAIQLAERANEARKPYKTVKVEMISSTEYDVTLWFRFDTETGDESYDETYRVDLQTGQVLLKKVV